MAAVRAAGGDLGAAGLALAEMAGLKGRGARVEIAARGGKALLIDESYNANPASMRATLTQLGQTRASRRIAVLGSMKELGDFGPGLHAALAEPLVAAGVDYAVLVGDEMQALADELKKFGELGKSSGGMLGKALRFAHCRTPAEAQIALADFGVESGDAILVKGSNSVGLGTLVSALTEKQG
jgi:UDP-N-acetylmuramoyl-tripeptide--D-alanyl-D-alanine ligase